MNEAASGIASLIARIKADGVEAGESERKARVDAATREAEEVVARARAEADRIVAAAREEADRRGKQLDAELRMAARDFVFRLQERLGAQVLGPATGALVERALADDDAVAGLIVDLMRDRTGGGRLTLDPTRRAALEAAVLRRVGDAVGPDGLEITDEAGLGGFRLVRRGEHFAWDVSQDALARELGRLVEPGLRAALSPKAQD